MSIFMKLASTFGRIGSARVPQMASARVPQMASTRLSSRQECREQGPPRCSPEALCGQDMLPKTSAWYNPACCHDPCPDFLPRFDDLYYKPSDKACRIYTQTWVECPELVVRPKKLCCFDNVQLPPMERRPRNKCPPTACPFECATIPCIDDKVKKCLRMQMPGCCRVARIPPRCHKERKKTICKKICAPYPSYSECVRCKPRPQRRIECHCLESLPRCSIWATMVNK